MIIFKCKTLPKSALFPSGVLVCTHEKGWMNRTGVIDWMKNVWNKRPSAVFIKHFLLVWDMFVAYRCEKVKKKAESLKAMLAAIPERLTSLL